MATRKFSWLKRQVFNFATTKAHLVRDAYLKGRADIFANKITRLNH